MIPRYQLCDCLDVAGLTVLGDGPLKGHFHPRLQLITQVLSESTIGIGFNEEVHTAIAQCVLLVNSCIWESRNYHSTYCPFSPG